MSHGFSLSYLAPEVFNKATKALFPKHESKTVQNNKYNDDKKEGPRSNFLRNLYHTLGRPRQLTPDEISWSLDAEFELSSSTSSPDGSKLLNGIGCTETLESVDFPSLNLHFDEQVEVLFHFNDYLDFWEVDESDFAYPGLSLLGFFREPSPVDDLKVELSTENSDLWDVINLESRCASDLEERLRKILEDAEEETQRAAIVYRSGTENDPGSAEYIRDSIDISWRSSMGDIADSYWRGSI
ncbi:hypothetical protein HYALB_00012682 [Hymenoscyphus albidus]|uniref:Uncharacterized protein n=1 Tax=Hymenoscyphus albidus TaxID=595503 RepID=A0A9N9LRL0_9HELO|nr:hypothetical protein HYALB_00012682 [Hymenoscyphus albidus]